VTIYLDTNVLPDQADVPDTVVSSILGIAREKRLPVCLPGIVLEESLARYARSLTAAQDGLRKGLREARKFWDVGSLYFPDPSQLVEERRAKMARLFEVVPTDGEDASTALIREVWRQPPAREGVGGRDSAVWLTILRHQRANADRKAYLEGYSLASL
jgi:hypothetical protein